MRSNRSLCALCVVVALTVTVLGSGSAWALTAEQEAELLASDGSTQDRLGLSVAIDGDTALLGAPGDGSPGNNNRGSAYVFTRSAGRWTQQAKLVAADGVAADVFGTSVALDGDTALIGAPGDDDETGSAYVFTRVGSVWTQQAKLLASGGAIQDLFGWEVALDDDTAVLGAYGDDDNGDRAGAAYVFTRIAGVWAEQAKLLASDGEAQEFFGTSVTLDGDTVIVGAPFDDDAQPFGGSAYVFTRTAGIWQQQAQLLPAAGGILDNFGNSVAVDADTALIGAHNEDDGGVDSGAVHVFTRTAGIWTELATLLPANTDDFQAFGTSVALDGDLALIGAYNDDANGDLTTYVFSRAAGNWSESVEIVPDGSLFRDVALDGNSLLIGAEGNHTNGTFAGSGYVYRLLPCGDGTLDPGEQCDDGNNTSGDGCAADCTIEDPVPATSFYGTIVLALALLTIMTAKSRLRWR